MRLTLRNLYPHSAFKIRHIDKADKLIRANNSESTYLRVRYYIKWNNFGSYISFRLTELVQAAVWKIPI